MKAHAYLQNSLIEDYRQLRAENTPEWAVHKRNSDELVVPAIPFVGKHYSEQKVKILVYASAENLSKYCKNNQTNWAGDWLDDDTQAENRHRKCFDDPAFQEDPFFPHVHLGPMNDGFLATAVYYIAQKLFQMRSDTPREFYEMIAFANYGKFSIETERQRNLRLDTANGGEKANIDYAGNADLLAASHGFIQSDLRILRPDCIIMPKSMYWADRLFVEAHRGSAMIVPISQINARVINCHIARNYVCPELEMLPACVQEWYRHLQKGRRTRTKENYLSVFDYLDHVLEEELR